MEATMRREFKALLGVALAAGPLQEVAFMLPHRAEFVFCVAVACALLALCSWTFRVETSERSQGVDNKALVAMLREVAKSHAATHGKVTADDLRRVAEKAGIELSSSVFGNVLRSGFKRIDEVKSSRPENHGRQIGVYALAG